jgi:hypothetical protein
MDCSNLGRPSVALLAPARSAVPASPELSQMLSNPGLAPWLAPAYREIGSTLV